MKFPARLRISRLMICSVLSAISIALLTIPAFPLGVSFEWLWERHAGPADMLELLDRLILPLIGAAMLWFVARFGERLLRTGSTIKAFFALSILVPATLLWHHAVQQASPSPHRELKPLWINYDKYATGYFFEAVFQIPSAGELLKTYEARMREGDVLHVGTHPPGLFLMSLGALHLTQRFPRLVDLLERIRSADTEQAFRELESVAAMAPPLTRAQLAGLQLVSLAAAMAAALAVIPVFLLAVVLSGQLGGKSALLLGWRAACLFSTVPAIAVFMPRSDVIYPFTATALLACGCGSLKSSTMVRRLILSAGAAVLLFAGMVLSLAHLPVLVVLTGFLLFRNLRSTRRNRLAQLITLFAGLAAFLGCVWSWFLLTDCNLPSVWLLNLKNHEGFYGQSPRTWWKWFFANPLELAFSAGWPLFAAAITTWIGALWTVGRALVRRTFVVSDVTAFVASTALTWSALWLSGKNMGEAARLWCFLTPWLALAAAAATIEMSEDQRRPTPADPGARLSADGPNSSRMWLSFLLLQMLTAIITVGRVNGFSF